MRQRANQQQAAATLRVEIGCGIDRTHPPPAVDDAEHGRIVLPVDADPKRRGAVADGVRQQLADDDLGGIQIRPPVVGVSLEELSNEMPDADGFRDRVHDVRPGPRILHGTRLPKRALNEPAALPPEMWIRRR